MGRGHASIQHDVPAKCAEGAASLRVSPLYRVKVVLPPSSLIHSDLITMGAKMLSRFLAESLKNVENAQRKTLNPVDSSGAHQKGLISDVLLRSLNLQVLRSGPGQRCPWAALKWPENGVYTACSDPCRQGLYGSTPSSHPISWDVPL